MNVEELFKQNNGYIETTGIKKRNIFYQLHKLQEQGLVERLRPGLYKHFEMSSGNEWEDVAHIVKDGIFCLRSACFYYKLGTDIPNEYQLAIPNKKKIRLPDYPLIKLFYWEEKYLNIGVTNTKVNNTEIHIYDIHKTVCDVIRFRNKLDDELLNQVVKNYLRSKDKNMDTLYKYGVIFKIEDKIQEYINLLLT